MTRTLRTLSVALLAVAACKQSSNSSSSGSETKPAADKKPASGDIVVGILADLTGPTADVGKPYNEGMLAYIDHLNSQGGIKNRKISAMSEDYAYKVPHAEEKYKNCLLYTSPSPRDS